MISKSKLIDQINSAEEALNVLRGYASVDTEDVLESSEKLGNIKYNFIVLIESCIDICNHISAKNWKIVPDTYSKCFSVLSDHDLLDKALSIKMSTYAKFRNLLVHLYWKVDDKEVVKKLDDLGNFNEYLKIVKAFIIKESD